MTRQDTLARGKLQDLGRQLRVLRDRQGLSLNQLAELSGVNVTSVRNIELGRVNPGLLTVVSVLDVLGVSLDDVMRLVRRAGKSVFVTRAPARGNAPLHRHLSEINEPSIRGRVVTLPAGTPLLPSRKGDAGSHFAYVLEGKVSVTTIDGRGYDLITGDSIHIADFPPRDFTNTGKRLARLLWIKDTRTTRAKSIRS